MFVENNYYHFGGSPKKSKEPESPEKLNQAERGFYSEGQKEAPNQEKETVSQRVSRRLQQVKATLIGSKRKKYAAASILVGVLFGGAGIMGLEYAAGPGQFVGISSLLEGGGPLGVQIDQSNLRAFRLIEHARKNLSGKNPTNNLDYIGNKIANAVETKLNHWGVESVYGGKLFQHLTEFKINPEADRFKNMSEAEIKDYFKTNYGLEVAGNVKDGLTVSADQLDAFSSREFIYNMLSDEGLNGVTSAIGAHVMAERDGFTLHPLRRLDYMVKEYLDGKLVTVNEKVKALKEWWKTRNTNIEEGTFAEDVATIDKEASNKKATASEKNVAAEEQAAAQAEQQIATSERDQALSGDTPFSSLSESSVYKNAMKGSLLVALLCIASSLNQIVNQLKETSVILPLIRTGMESVSIGNQTKASSDISNSEMGMYSKLLYSNRTHTSFASARSMQALMGEPQTGPKPSATLADITHGSPLAVVSTIPGINAVCSPIVQAGLTVLSFLGGPVSTVVQYALSPLFKDILTTIAKWIVGIPVDPNSSGANYGYAITYGTALAANDQAVSQGGTQLSQASSNKLAAFAQQLSNQQFKQHSFWYRTFSLSNPRSLFGHFLLSISPSFFNNLTTFSSFMINMGRTLANLPMGIIDGSVSAASLYQPYNYGFPMYGFSTSDMNSPNVSNPYTNGNQVATLLSNNNLIGGINGESSKCFGVTFVNGPHGWDTQNSFNYFNIYDNIYQNYNCGTPPSGLTSAQWLQVRMFVYDMQQANGLACYFGSNTACMSNGDYAAVAANISGNTSKHFMSAPGAALAYE